ncbi:MAG TPA: DUF4198 domain-containing protein, partial [Lacipirellula sp.]
FIVPKAPVWISADVTWGDVAFTAMEAAGKQSIAILGPDGKRLAPASVFVGKTKTTAEVELTSPGSYRIEATDPPTYWTQLRIDGKEQWKKSPKNEITSGEIIRSDLYYAEAVAFVTVGRPTPLPEVDPEDPLEIRLREHPSNLHAGKLVELQVLSYGKHVSGAKLKVFGEGGDGHRPDLVVDCDSQGRGKVNLDRAGRYLLSSELERAVENDPKADMHAFNAYLTVVVLK